MCQVIINVICGKPPQIAEPADRLLFLVRNLSEDPLILQGENMLILTDSQKCELTVQPVTKAGNPAPIDGVPTWTVSDPTILDIQPDVAGLKAVILSKGKLGTCQVAATADADMGAGTTPITNLLDVEVKAGAAVSLSISAGVPTEITATPPPVVP